VPLITAGTQKNHKGVVTNLLGPRDERSFSWYGRGWEVRLDWFMEQAFHHGRDDPRFITDAFMHVLYRYGIHEVNSRGCPHVHCIVKVRYATNRSAIEDGAEEIGYEDIEEMNDRRKQRLAGEDAACKEDNKTYQGARRFDGDDGGAGYTGAGYGGWKRGSHDYTAPSQART
jgi:hypothetical protein